MDKPREVNIAVKLLWVALAVFLVLAFADCIVQGSDELSKLKPLTFGIRTEITMGVFLTALVFFRIFIIQSIGRGRNWARQLLLLLFLHSIFRAFDIQGTSISLKGDLGPGTFSPLVFIAIVLEASAVFILFFNSVAKQWFRGQARA